MFLSIFSGVFGVQVGFPYLSGNLPPIPSIYIYLYSHLNPLYFSLLFLHPSLSLSALIPLLLHLRGSTFYPPLPYLPLSSSFLLLPHQYTLPISPTKIPLQLPLPSPYHFPFYIPFTDSTSPAHLRQVGSDRLPNFFFPTEDEDDKVE